MNYRESNSDNNNSKKRVIHHNDGAEYEWNEKGGGWYPKISDEFIADYQANYGFSEDLKPTPHNETTKTTHHHKQVKKKVRLTLIKKLEKRDKEKKQTETEWFQVGLSSSGMPTDVTEDEFLDMMLKFGIIMEDQDAGKLKIKLYKDSQGNYKGDGLCCYLKPESVQLAINILDDSDMRGHKIKASFELKGDFNPNLKKKPKKKKKGIKNQEKLLAWVERDQKISLAHKRACVIHNLFDPKELQDNPAVKSDYQEDLKDECVKFGDVKKVFVFPKSKDGVASILFKDEEAAEKCVKVMDGRFCNGKNLIAHLWDGVTKYEEKETPEEEAERIKKWHESLESNE